MQRSVPDNIEEMMQDQELLSLGIDPTLIRLGWALFCVVGGSGFLAYIIAVVIIPERPDY